MQSFRFFRRLGYSLLFSVMLAPPFMAQVEGETPATSPDLQGSADRIAEIFRRAADEKKSVPEATPKATPEAKSEVTGTAPDARPPDDPAQTPPPPEPQPVGPGNEAPDDKVTESPLPAPEKVPTPSPTPTPAAATDIPSGDTSLTLQEPPTPQNVPGELQQAIPAEPPAEVAGAPPDATHGAIAAPAPAAEAFAEPSPDPPQTAEVGAGETEAPSEAPSVPGETEVTLLPVPPVEGSLPTTPATGSAEDSIVRLPEGEPHTPTASVTINLINLLVKKGVLTAAEAQEMVAQAHAEAEIARMESQAQMVEVAQIIAMDVTAEQLAAEAAMPQPDGSDVRVAFVPESVKQEIREQVRYDLQEDALAGDWALGQSIPAWVGRLNPHGDIRLRWQGITFPGSNNTTGAFPNFNAINTGPPFDVTGNVFSPQLNTDQDRNYFLTRVRFGLMVDLHENFTGGIRLATGTNNSPVSTNQGSGTPGYFTKYALWLDRALLTYEFATFGDDTVRLTLGRMDNPFFSTPLIFDDDLGFDGFALEASYTHENWLSAFLNAGAFPVYNTDLNFATNNPEKFPSYDKYLFGIQAGSNLKLGNEFALKTAAAYYYWYNIEGRLSSPFVPLSASDAGDTDNSRPSFAQKGNTYMALRDIIPDASNDFGAINQWQYFGLATPFQNVAFTGRFDWNRFEPVQVSLLGELVWNVAWDRGDINRIAVNNRGAIPGDDLSDTLGSYVGTNFAWNLELRVGAPVLQKRWDWILGFGYRYVGSDAVVDAFNDSDFGLGGTNIQGFTVSGSLALSPNVWLGARWMNANSIAGPTYRNDVIQFDINAKF